LAISNARRRACFGEAALGISLNAPEPNLRWRGIDNLEHGLIEDAEFYSRRQPGIVGGPL
jgi:hypothetical protein